MDPDLFYQLHELGAHPNEIEAVKAGLVSGENLLAYLEADVEGRRTPQALPAPEPLPAVTTQPLPVLADPILPTIEAPQQPVVRAMPPPQEEPIEYVRVEPQPANQVPIGGEGGPQGSWLVETEGEQVAGSYPTFSTQNLSPLAAGAATMVVSTATEKIFDKISGNGNGSTPQVAGVSRTYSGRRRRRRRLLTCSDKADIAYLVGQLGQGQLGKAAISALLSRRCG